LAVKDSIEASLPKRNGKSRDLTKEDFSQKGAIYLRPKAQFDYLVALTDQDDRAKALIEAMESIEQDYQSLKGVLPKNDYQQLDNDIIGQLLRTLNPEELRKATGDVFGRIYEYFLTGFADLKAHDNGEFFTPVSLVSMIANVIEPKEGIVLDPACGSGGMFVQSAHFVERMHQNPTERLTFYGLEKNQATINLAKMNLAVHGLEGNIRQAITYYNDPHALVGKANYVMANPPFNVDEVDAEKLRNDPRLPFGLPGTNKGGKVSNGNFLWISFFYSYLKPNGRAGFVMSSQASSAGRDEAKVRQKLVETGHVDAMMSIRSNFFYTRTVPCELWFFDKGKPEEHKDKVLMIDARNVYRKVTRKIFDFSPEQQQNLLSIVWLYRGQTERFQALVKSYLDRTRQEAKSCFASNGTNLAASFLDSVKTIKPYLDKCLVEAEHEELRQQFKAGLDTFKSDVEAFRNAINYSLVADVKGDLPKQTHALTPLAETSRNLIKQADALYKLINRIIDLCQGQIQKSESEIWPANRELQKVRKAADGSRQKLIEQLKLVRYFHRQAVWLTEKFPGAKLRNIPGLVKLVDKEDIEAADWSLTPARYVGVAPEEVDEDFDFEEAIKNIHIELQDLNTEASELAAKIAKNFEELGA
jgi:type I restriction enzyme M protein